MRANSDVAVPVASPTQLKVVEHHFQAQLSSQRAIRVRTRNSGSELDPEIVATVVDPV